MIRDILLTNPQYVKEFNKMMKFPKYHIPLVKYKILCSFV